jgi:capsid portal protein
MRNSYINRYRKAVKTPELVDYDEIKEFYNTIREQSSDANDLSERLYGQLLDDEIAGALTELPEEFRTVVILCDIEGFTYEEAANSSIVPSERFVHGCIAAGSSCVTGCSNTLMKKDMKSTIKSIIPPFQGSLISEQL